MQKLKLAQVVRFNRDFSTVRIAGEKLVKRDSVDCRGLYVFDGFASHDKTLLFTRIGGRSSFIVPVDAVEYNASGGYYEIQTDLFNKPLNLSGREKLKSHVVGLIADFKRRYTKGFNHHLPQQNRLDGRFAIVDKYLKSQDCTVIRCKLTGLPVFFDGKTIKTWRKPVDITFGVSKAKTIALNDLATKYDFDADGLKSEYHLRYGAYNATLHAVTLKMTKLLSEWHRDNGVSSCMLYADATNSRVKNFYRFYRRSRFQFAIVKDCNNNVIARAMVDSNGNYTRIYSVQSAITNKLETALSEIGLTKAGDYDCDFYAINRNDELCIPYIDGQRQNFDVVEETIELKNGKTLTRCEFSHNGDYSATSTVFKVALDNNKCTCADCGERFDYEREGAVLQNGESICQSCYQENYFYCEECDETCHNDTQTRYIYVTHNGRYEENWCCESCADNMESIPYRR